MTAVADAESDASRRCAMHVITGLGIGGAERALVNLAEREAAAGMPPTVVSIRSPDHFYYVLQDRGVEVLSLGVDSALSAPAGVIALARLIRRRQPGVVACWMYHANLFGLLALLVSGRRRRTRLVWGIRCSDMDFRTMLPLTRLAARIGAWLSRLPDALIVNSHAGAAVHRLLGYVTAPTLVVPNGFDTESFTPDEAARRRIRGELGIPDEAVVVGMVARDDPMKNYPAFLAAARALPELQFVAVGAGTAALPGPPNFRGLGARSDVPAVLNAFDIFALTSAYGEGTSNAVGEAMACGLPVVATDVGDAAHLLGEEAGTIVPPRDQSRLVAAIAAFARDPAARRAAGERARARVESVYSMARNAAAFRAILHGEATGLVTPEEVDAEPRPRGRGRALGVAARTFVSVGLLAALLVYIDFGSVYGHLARLGEHPWPFAAAFAGLLLQVGLVSVRLQIMFRAMGTALPFMKVAVVAVSSAIANALVSMSGVLVRMLLNVEELVPVRRIVILFVVERMIVLATLCLFCVPVLWIAISGGAPAVLLQTIDSLPELRLGIVLAAVAIVLAVGLGGAVALRLSPALQRMLQAVRDELSVMVRRGKTRMLAAFGLSVLGQGLSVGSTVLVAVSLGYDGPLLPVALLLPVPMLLAALPIAVGGWGVRELLFVIVLGTVGVTQGLALTLSLLLGVLSLLALLAWQLGLLGISLIRRESTGPV